MKDKPTYDELFSRVNALENELAECKDTIAGLDKCRLENELLFRNSPFVMFIVDENRRVCRVNKATEKLTRRIEAESMGLLGGEALRCAHALDDTERCGFRNVCQSCVVRNTVLETFKTGTPHNFVETSIPFRTPEGISYRHMQLFTSLIPHPSGPRVLVCMEDITDRKRVENKLTKSEARFTHAMEASKDGIWDWHVDTGQVYYSPGYLRMLGYEKDEVPHELSFWSDHIHPDDKADAIGVNQGCINNAYDEFEVEYRLRNKQEGWLWILGRGKVVERDTDGKALRLVGTHTNITERKRSEQRSITSRQEMKSIFRTAPTGIGVIKNRVITKSNLKLLEITGYTKEELVGRAARMLYSSDEEFEFVGMEKYRQIDKKGTGTVETRWRRKDGKIIDILLSSTPIDFQDYAKGVTFTALDITKRKNIERALKFQALLLNNIQDHVTATDLDGNILYVNEAEIKSTKRSREELLDQSVDIYGENASKGATQKEIVDSTLNNGRWRGEVVNYAADGSEVIMDCRTQLINDEEGNPWRMVGVSTDITERKQSESEKELLLTAIEQSHEAVVITDARGDIQYANPSFENLTGYDRQEVIGKTPKVLKSGVHDTGFYTQMWDTISAGKTWIGEITNRKKDGTLFTEEASISPIQNTAGKIVNYVAVKRDITEELRLKNRLAHAQKLEAIGTLAGGIAHDFNNILFPIIGYTEILMSDISSEDKTAQSSLEQIHVSALRAKDLVQQILTFSRQEKTEYRPLKVQLIAKEVLKLLRSTIPKEIEITQRIDRNCGPVHADATQVHQILMNLATNACHAMESRGGRLTITLQEIILDSPKVTGTDIPEGKYMELSVSDTGVGMSPDLIGKIFDPYFTTKEKGRGTGIGLSVVHGIVKNMDGHIKIDSIPGKGSDVRVYIPVTMTDTLPNHAHPAIQSLRKGCETILLVDDEDPIVKLETQALERLGYAVEAQTDPIEALTIFRSTPDAYDLVLTDLSMPKMNGQVFAEEIRNIRPDIPIILCTGFSEKLTPAAAKSIGITEVIKKPVILKDLSEKIRQVLDQPSDT